MDQEHENNLSPEENAWLDEILPPEDLGEELGPHESVEDAGLVSPDAPEDGWDPEAKSRMTGEPFQDEELPTRTLRRKPRRPLPRSRKPRKKPRRSR